MADEKDLPAISLPNESTHVDINPIVKGASKPAAPPARQRPPTDQLKVQKPAPAARPPAPQRPAPAAAPGRPATEAVNIQKPATPSAQQPAEPSQDDDDPETLLRQYADRQKTKISRLEHQIADYRKTVAERDDLRAKNAALSKELEEAKKQVQAAAKADEVIKDLQSRVDAAILSNSMLTDENGKLKKAVQDFQASSRKFEEKATIADRASVEAQKALAAQTESRKAAQSRIASALQALQGDGAPRRPVVPAAPPPPVAPRKK